MFPFTKSRNYPSLIISEEKIQVIQLDNSGKKVSQLAEERLPPETIVRGTVKDASRLAESLKKLFGAANIQERLVVVGIPENKCYTKVFDLPKLKIDELGEAVSWEADTYLPVESEKVHMDWKIISEEEKDTIRVLLIAVPKEIIEGYTAALQEGGLTPVAYETTALSLIRLIEKQKIRALIIEIQSQHATLTLSKGKAIEASSIVAFSGEDEGKGLKHLIQTVNEMLTYYEEKRKGDEKVKSIYICGEGATDTVRNQIAQGTNRDVKFVPIPIENMPEGKDQSFAVIASLAKKDIQAPKDEDTINLLPPAIQQGLDRIRSRRVNKLLLTISTGVTTSTTVASLIALIALKSMNASLESEKLELSPLPPEAGTAITETQRLNLAANTIVKVGTSRVFPQRRIANTLGSIPEGVSVVRITLDEKGKKIQISGRARTRAELLKFKDNLEGTQDFSKAILPLSSLQQSENIDFIITLNIN